MKLAKDFLEKFKKFSPPDGILKQTIADAASFVAGVPITKKDVTLSHGVVFINTSSIAKSALRVKRAALFEYIFSRVPKARDRVRDIR